MTFDLIKKLNRVVNPSTRKISALQIEVSTYCQLECGYCPRTVLASTWQNATMRMKAFEERILPYVSLFEMIFLQGWGEPLTHPQFWDMVAMIKLKGSRVGFLTNGILFDRQAAETACDLGVDLIAFTFAGACAATHERYRNGSDFKRLRETIPLLSGVKKEKGLNSPLVGISYTLMRDNVAEFPSAVELAGALGASQIVASHLDCIPSRTLESEAVFLFPEQEDDAGVLAAGDKAKQLGIAFKAEPVRMTGEILVCEPNPLHVTLYVRVDGSVVPCHQMALAPESVRTLFFKGEEFEYCPVVLGNVNEMPLPDIIDGQAARRIFQVFDDRAHTRLNVYHQLPDAPEICKKCYKLYGV